MPQIPTKVFDLWIIIGLIRNYNEDRVAIILSITQPTNKSCNYWPKISFFGIYDGHGGAKCADFLRDNLH
jgi:protein phosphatase 2C family protein 2/3